jgi:hypothetical protein
LIAGARAPTRTGPDLMEEVVSQQGREKRGRGRRLKRAS